MKKLLFVMAALAAAGAMVVKAEDAAKPAEGPRGGHERMGMRLDKDGDGKITVDEFVAMSAERAKMRFERADADKDGKVTEAEMNTVRSAMASRPAGDDRARPEVPKFADLDTNKDGVILLDEYTAALKGKAVERAKEMDKNGDGILSKDELPMMAGPHREGPPAGGAPAPDPKP
jgi:hypothetical protein